jgi:hypothetical protein
MVTSRRVGAMPTFATVTQDTSEQFAPAPLWPAATQTSPFEEYARTEMAGARRLPARSDSGRWLDRHCFVILCAAAALPALRLPGEWLIMCAVVTVVFLGIDAVRGHDEKKTEQGSADVVVVPARFAGKIALGFVNPLNWLKLLMGALIALGAGALAGALIAALRWLTTEGTDGVFAAARMGAWDHAARYGAVVGCFLLLVGGKHTRLTRAAVLRRVTTRLPEAAVAGVTVCAVVLFGTFVLAVPNSSGGVFTGDDGLAWVPPGLRTSVNSLRDDVVRAELTAVASCMSGSQRNLFVGVYAPGKSTSDPDVAQIVVDPSRPQSQAVLAAAALAAQNQLAPWVEVLEVTSGGQVVLTVDRSGIAHEQPLTDAKILQAHSLGAPDWLTAVAPTVDTKTVLDCSSRTPF